MIRVNSRAIGKIAQPLRAGARVAFGFVGVVAFFLMSCVIFSAWSDSGVPPSYASAAVKSLLVGVFFGVGAAAIQSAATGRVRWTWFAVPAAILAVGALASGFFA
jgi:uncharacterized membrane protein YczE